MTLPPATEEKGDQRRGKDEDRRRDQIWKQEFKVGHDQEMSS
jgi:hypothetical protein